MVTPFCPAADLAFADDEQMMADLQRQLIIRRYLISRPSLVKYVLMIR